MAGKLVAFDLHRESPLLIPQQGHLLTRFSKSLMKGFRSSLHPRLVFPKLKNSLKSLRPDPRPNSQDDLRKGCFGIWWGLFSPLLFLILFLKNNSACLGTEEFIFPLVKTRAFADSQMSFLFPGMRSLLASFSENRTHVFVLELTSSSLSSGRQGPWPGCGGGGAAAPGG